MHILKKLLPLTALAILLVACAPTIESSSAETAPAPTPVPVDEAEGVDLRIEIEESFLANMLNEQLAEPIAIPGQEGVEVLVQEPVFDLAPGGLAKVTATLDLDVYGITAAARPTINLMLAAEAGQINVSLAGINLGDVRFPLDAVEDQLAGVEETIRTQLAGALQGVTEATGLQVKELLVTDSALVVDLGR
jgi:hypothetical protein